MSKTTTHQLVEAKLGADLVKHVRKMRQDGKSWQNIAVDIAIKTQISVTPESVRNWMADEKGMERKTSTTTPGG